jgi:hypothetical protein
MFISVAFAAAPASKMVASSKDNRLMVSMSSPIGWVD